MMRETLIKAVNTYTEEWVIAAIDEAVNHNARNWAYCSAILNSWKTNGFKAAKKNGAAPTGADFAGSSSPDPELSADGPIEYDATLSKTYGTRTMLDIFLAMIDSLESEMPRDPFLKFVQDIQPIKMDGDRLILWAPDTDWAHDRLQKTMERFLQGACKERIGIIWQS
jgi:DnaD/phage-associated family protein